MGSQGRECRPDFGKEVPKTTVQSDEREIKRAGGHPSALCKYDIGRNYAASAETSDVGAAAAAACSSSVMKAAAAASAPPCFDFLRAV